ncbi:hypothetical protein ACIBG8_19430 [Nonomuraea sp. NPDC050556]|uniref:hypothetical protein n=1 Tax=Nonomuraea sp. NPDC050556 TaxID=3364369 RepID=UPI00378CEE3B
MLSFDPCAYPVDNGNLVMMNGIGEVKGLTIHGLVENEFHGYALFAGPEGEVTYVGTRENAYAAFDLITLAWVDRESARA